MGISTPVGWNHGRGTPVSISVLRLSFSVLRCRKLDIARKVCCNGVTRRCFYTHVNAGNQREEIEKGFSSIYSKVAGLQSKWVIAIQSQMIRFYVRLEKVSDQKSQNLGNLYGFLANTRRLGWAWEYFWVRSNCIIICDRTIKGTFTWGRKYGTKIYYSTSDRTVG